jgi:hypothetical protein
MRVIEVEGEIPVHTTYFRMFTCNEFVSERQKGTPCYIFREHSVVSLEYRNIDLALVFLCSDSLPDPLMAGTFAPGGGKWTSR